VPSLLDVRAAFYAALFVVLLLGVNDALDNPRLPLFNANGALLAENDDWQGSDAGNIRRRGFAPSSTLEAALSPGSRRDRTRRSKVRRRTKAASV
jgi:hypothetical protein